MDEQLAKKKAVKKGYVEVTEDAQLSVNTPPKPSISARPTPSQVFPNSYVQFLR